MNILLYIPQMWPCSPKFRIEVIYNHWKKKDTLTILKCRGELKECCVAIDSLAPKDAATGCSKCMRDFFHVMDMHRIPYSSIKFLSFDKKRNHIVIPDFESSLSLEQYKYKGADIGAAALNTLANCIFDSEPDLVAHKTLLTNFLICGAHLFDHFDKISPQFDRIYFWGGRTIVDRPAQRACEKNGVEYVCHEYGYAQNTYIESVQTSYHNIDYWKPIISSEWSGGCHKKTAIAEEFFQKKREKKDPFLFTDFQKTNLLPPGFDSSKHNIAMFDTSILETLGIEAFHSKTPPKDFMYIVYLIARSLEDKKHIKLYLRAHPNIKQFYTSTHNPYVFATQQKMLRVLSALKLKNLYVIFPHEPIDTYALVENCATTLTCGSTIGIEATYWGKANVLLGRAWYEQLNVSYTPSDFVSLLTLLQQQNLPPKPRENTFPYAFHLSTHGQPFVTPPDWKWEERKYLPFTRGMSMFFLKKFYHFQVKFQKYFSFLSTKSTQDENWQVEMENQIKIAEEFYAHPPKSDEFDKFYCGVHRCASNLGLNIDDFVITAE